VVVVEAAVVVVVAEAAVVVVVAEEAVVVVVAEEEVEDELDCPLPSWMNRRHPRTTRTITNEKRMLNVSYLGICERFYTSYLRAVCKCNYLYITLDIHLCLLSFSIYVLFPWPNILICSYITKK